MPASGCSDSTSFTSHRKRKADDDPGGEDKSSISGRGRSGESSFADDNVIILRAAIEFQNRTGLNATSKPGQAAVYDVVNGSLSVPLSQKQVYNRLRTIRHKFNNSAVVDDDDLVFKLAAQLWSTEVPKKSLKDQKKQISNTVEEDASEEGNLVEKSGNRFEDASRKGKKLKVDQDSAALEKEEKRIHNGEGLGIEAEDFPYLTHSVTKQWKALDLPDESLQEVMKLVNPAKAKALEDKWSKLAEDKIKYEMNWASTCNQLLALLLKKHKSMG
ncbi:hypothetical protein Cni_G09070 [Canna indica]|uniref:Glabrous enhancer-binding protein-like DBD domain-containing protein n=1 Tax=Canna indica TaxID=4628 RepID=A0AAQ3K1Z9_9LILI|nr:hypothetical protein Cni_G09070 [Canna indica]